MAIRVTGYSTAQIALHWAVVVLVAFQYLAHAGIEAMWNASLGNFGTSADTIVLGYMHIGAGGLILLFVIARIYLRMTRGVPPPPADEPKPLKILSETVHGLIYILLLGLPLSGTVGWFFSIKVAVAAHIILKNVLLAAIALHIAGAFFQHFVMRSTVLMRMLSPQRR